MNLHSARLNGKCACGYVSYHLIAQPMIVHCCHCTWCQRETGTAFALNAVLEANAVEMESGKCEIIDTPSQSGNGQKIARCPKCRVAVWSHYHQAGSNISFVRVGALSQPEKLPPDIHIYTSTKQPWVVIPEGVPSTLEFYNPREIWSTENLQRFMSAKS
jgi:hypothetical protein